MKRLKFILGPSLMLCLLSFSVLAFSQTGQTDIEELKKDAPKVFLDCGSCDIDYIRTEITYVNYVRDRKEAQVHVLITTQRTGSGGREYTISLIGQLDFEGINDIHKYFTEQTDTADEIRAGLTNALKIALASYAAKTPIASRLNVSYTEKAEKQAVEDKWNNWVFRVSGSTNFYGQKSQSSRYFNGSLSAARITDKFKSTMSFSTGFDKSEYVYEDDTIESEQNSMSFDGLFVKSLGEHWSVGAYLRADSSTHDNVEFDINPSPAIEYNLFPYSESTRRQFRFLYKIGISSIRYREETIYNKTSETLWKQSLSATLDIKEKWGSVSTSLSGSHYLHDFGKYRLNLFTIINVRLVKGLSFIALGSASKIRDQLNLPKGEASLEDVLLQIKELETGYSYFVSVGFSYTFGSIFTNVVNPRFGSSGSGGISVIID